ncbi:CpXC domain-containing protein [Evansella tamaricis]|uniref:CpXC domain-containing protein n=1 Tax=Evansella tamaricis TaxID=2069301 RepID=A0ABS6JJK3_9BACI|nr:CpXC domain-containing protein [Evansella tamaricis]MBU9713718.1 CpXC domain-containing protein [Evansella tamaricis]
MPISLFTQKRIEQRSHVICPSCNEKTSYTEWNQIAKDVYGKNSPDIRAASLNPKVSFPFQCPNCHMGYSAHLLQFTDK